MSAGLPCRVGSPAGAACAASVHTGACACPSAELGLSSAVTSRGAGARWWNSAQSRAAARTRHPAGHWTRRKAMQGVGLPWAARGVGWGRGPFMAGGGEPRGPGSDLAG